MLGFRGCRLGIGYPEISAMQARAVFEAAAIVQKEGIKVRPEIMIPLVGFKKELDLQIEVVHQAAREVQAEQKVKLNYLVGTMIEIPRGALTADEIAQSAEFFSFGTNDLTQTGLGMSRDDSGSFLPQYQELEIVTKNPFATIDATGVGQLVEIAVTKGRATRPNIKLGICGEHGGDPASIQFFEKVGLDYVSCSPFRVPVARLAAAQAALHGQGRGLITDLSSTRAGPPHGVDTGGPRLAQAGERTCWVWVDLDQPTPEEARILTDVFHFHELAMEDALSELHHPKIESYGDYLYLILHGIDFRAPEHCFTTKDIDFFLGERYLVTVHPGVSRSIGKVGEVCARDARVLGEGPGVTAVPHRRHDGRQLPAGGREAPGAARSSSRRKCSNIQTAAGAADPRISSETSLHCGRSCCLSATSSAGSRDGSFRSSASRWPTDSATSTIISCGCPTRRCSSRTASRASSTRTCRRCRTS